MPTVQFKAKVQKAYFVDNSLAYECVNVPALTRSHCDMQAFRNDKKFGGYANSELFVGMLNGAAKKIIGNKIKLDAIPEGVQVDTSGFLAVITFTV